MRAAGIDFGDRRIGVAVTVEDSGLTLPLTCLERKNDRQALAALVSLLAPRGLECLFVGEPRAGSGTAQHPQAERIRRFGRRLAARLGVRVSFIDESFTSLEALARLGPRAGLRTPEAVDALAAQLILESGLELWKRGRISAEKP